MKKVLLFSSVIMILGLTGCSNKYFNDWFSSEQNETDKICQQVIEAYKQQDSEMAEPVYMFPTLSEFNLEVCALGQAITVGGEDVDSALQSFETAVEPIIP